MPSSRVVNHSGWLVAHGWSGRALQCQVERDLQAELAGPRDERVEVGERPEVRVDRVVAALVRADGPRRAGVVRPGVQGVVGPLAVDPPDRVDRRDVDDVEAHRGDGREPLHRGAEGAGPPAAVGVLAGALRAREQLVPGAVQRPLALHPDRVRRARGHHVAQRPLGQLAADLGRGAGGEADRRRAARVLQRGDRVQQGPGLRRGALHLGHGPAQQHGALGQHQLGVDVRGDLDRRVVLPRGVRVAPALDRQRPQALRVGDDRGTPPVQAGPEGVHPGDGPAAVRGGQDGRGVHRAVPLGEHRGA